MFRPLILLAMLTPFTAGHSAEAWQATARDEGLSAAATVLRSAPQDAETSFARGAVQALRAVEVILQTRYQTYSGRLPLVPGMARAIPTNPNARFDPAFIEEAMRAALAELADAERALSVATSGEFAVVVDLDEVWLDIDADGARSSFEALPVVFAALGRRSDEFDGKVRFDSADADWLKAYVHALSAMAELVLAVDPTPAIQRVVAGRAAMALLGAVEPTFDQPAPMLEIAAAAVLTLRGVPEATRTRAAHAHLKAAIRHNRSFWRKVESEQDDDREWLPNSRQTSAFGVTVDGELASRWQGVLAELESIIDGDTLLPFWRMGGRPGAPGVGVNLKRVLTEPGDMDLVLWIQGTGAVPYLERGTIASGSAWRDFRNLTRGDALLFALWLN